MKRRGIKIALILLGISTLLVFAFNGYPTVTKEDRTYIEQFLAEWNIAANKDSIHASFEREVAFVSQVQDSLLKSIKSVEKTNDNVGHMASYFKNRSGICFDRAIMLEKIFAEYGFTSRHLYVYFNIGAKSTSFIDFFKSGLHSHALLEVLTKKGWMVVGTNHNWLGLDTNFNPLTLGQVRNQLANDVFQTPKPSSKGDNFFSVLTSPTNFRFVYGVYSRHGKFLDSNQIENSLAKIGIRLPDYNLRMLLYNF